MHDADNTMESRLAGHSHAHLCSVLTNNQLRSSSLRSHCQLHFARSCIRACFFWALVALASSLLRMFALCSSTPS